ncbi:MAG TPA: TonB-dependent receptor plug domain-containing protein, partial [Chitinophagaceae bacterium]|nr:TonB-dependent receptor plug domain-containing protein [Chitinophagaceae bacterium]
MSSAVHVFTRCLLLFIAYSCFSNSSFGQTIRGLVSDSTGTPLAGATVEINGTSVRAITDVAGLYSITSPQQLTPRSTVQFSYTGFKTARVPLDGRTNINVVLHSEQRMLSDVVVTALGIRREEKSLGYAAQSVNENAVKDAKTNNWVNSLSGKVAGLNIQGTGAGPMGSSRITLRGESSLNLDNNQALIVVDGVPISRRITGTGFSSHLSADSPVDFGSSLSDLNPDDIEKVTVLKGA